MSGEVGDNQGDLQNQPGAGVPGVAQPDAANLEQQPGSPSGVALDDQARKPLAPEQREVLSLKLTVDRPCNNPNGLYVSLLPEQRRRLNVNVGDSVVVRNPNGGEVISLYTVGLGLKELKGKPESCGINGIQPGAEIVIEKSAVEHSLLNLPLRRGVETDELHKRRAGKIMDGRFNGQDVDPEVYIVLPTAIAKCFVSPPEGVSSGRDTVLSISLGKIKIGGQEFILPVVPAGVDFGLTTKAALKLGIPDGNLSNVQYYLNDEGVLVINQVS